MSVLRSERNRSFFGEPPQQISSQFSSVVEQHVVPDALGQQNQVANAVNNEGMDAPVPLVPNNASQNSAENNSNVIVSSGSSSRPIDPKVSGSNSSEYSNHNPACSTVNLASSLNMAQDENSLNMLTSCIEALNRSFHRMRRREVTSPSLPTEQVNEFIRFELNLFVSRREYENGRCLLMRNLRSIPSLCQLVSASSILTPDTAVNSVSTTP
ncbi:unnamed protein product [Schistosoma mattheei]|uniref:Uncharacterized protein n=1 Tax=Schistosoma mattheei TaxID=31246 RepID=A0A183PD72_9TREM|nr:unnamed protein product [Schistosoma mattheei]